jgi:hypothetical protein
MNCLAHALLEYNVRPDHVIFTTNQTIAWLLAHSRGLIHSHLVCGEDDMIWSHIVFQERVSLVHSHHRSTKNWSRCCVLIFSHLSKERDGVGLMVRHLSTTIAWLLAHSRGLIHSHLVCGEDDMIWSHITKLLL